MPENDAANQPMPMLDAGTLLPTGAGVLPFGISNDSPAAIAALRRLADAMERGEVHMLSAQTGTVLDQEEFAQFRVFLEYQIKPKWGG